MRVAAGIVALLCACALSACGTRAAGSGSAGKSDSDQVRAKVSQLGQAAADHDYRTICEQVLAPSLVTKLADAGITCQRAMQIAWGNLVDPSLSVGQVVIRGDTAQAITLTMAKGQQASVDGIDLIKTPSGWRISSLSAPIIQNGGS
jgi:hypothetical protein